MFADSRKGVPKILSSATDNAPNMIGKETGFVMLFINMVVLLYSFMTFFITKHSALNIIVCHFIVLSYHIILHVALCAKHDCMSCLVRCTENCHSSG